MSRLLPETVPSDPDHRNPGRYGTLGKAKAIGQAGTDEHDVVFIIEPFRSRHDRPSTS